MNSYSAYSDNELVNLFRSGDGSAFDEIYRRYLPLLYDTVYKRLKSKEYSEDVLQEVFARLWLKREALQIVDLVPYLHTAVRNETINFITRNKKVVAFFEFFEMMLTEKEAPDDKLRAKEMFKIIYSYAATLPEKRREIFLFHIKDRLTTKEIAELLGISQKTVQNQLATALQGLRSNIMPVVLAMLVYYFTEK